MNVEYYIQRPQPTLVVQLTQADEAEIIAALADPNLTITRDSSGHWKFKAESGIDHEADDGDWVALNGYWIGPADDKRASPAWQQVPAATVSYNVT